METIAAAYWKTSSYAPITEDDGYAARADSCSWRPRQVLEAHCAMQSRSMPPQQEEVYGQ
jgi:hypothetical protein